MDYPPSHRNRGDEQPEFCDLCGSLVGRDHLIESEVEGLRGRVICDIHPHERVARLAPSHNDLLAVSPTPDQVTRDSRLWPYGSESLPVSPFGAQLLPLIDALGQAVLDPFNVEEILTPV